MEVVSASQGVLGPLPGKLTALLADECRRLKGVHREIRSLRSELTSMRAAIQKYTMLQDPDVEVKTWISLVRELAYDIEDVIDKFIHQLGNGGHDGGLKEFFRKTARRLKTLGSRRGIADQITDLKARVKQVKELKSSFKLEDIACSTFEHSAVDPRLSALFSEDAYLVGIDGLRDEFANWMVGEEANSTKHPRVLSIVGFGGLGKTTLANEVYREIQGHFQCQAFVSVSQKPIVKKIIKDVISQVLSQVQCEEKFKEDMDTWDEKKSITKLRELLQDKKYLMVIDDLWSIPAWNAIKCAFPKNSCSSRIIATTRILDVARSCSSGGYNRIYEMEALSDLHSKRLFFKRIFDHEDCCPGMLKEVSNEILKKCGGLPLAIISISGLLANRPPIKEEWEKVKRSIGYAMEKDRSLEGMNNILSLSYNDLPSNLKTCLLYLSIFPEDYVIERERLVRRWIAEGFISEEHGQSRQEIAESYFYELINKSMVQPVDIGYDGKVRACRVHDMMLELIVSKSAEENFITVVGSGQKVLANPHGSIRRLLVQHLDEELASVLANEDLSHVRSLTVTASGCIKHLPSLVEFEGLRVLDFEGCDMEKFDMSGIGKLYQLKYLSLRDTLGISNLPSGIVMLHDLETLDLRNTCIEELPAGIVQLIKLQNLLLDSYDVGETKIPDGIGNMKNLRVITGFNITESSVGAVGELGNLAGLEELHLVLNDGGSKEFKRHEEMLLSSLCKLGSCMLRSLLIHSDSTSITIQFLDSWSPLPSRLQTFKMGPTYYLPKIAKWITPKLTSLAYLDINLIELTEEDLRILGEMPALLSLHVDTSSFQKERLTVRDIGFPCLKEFKLPFHYRWNAIYLTFEEGAMPKLERLRLLFCVLVAEAYGFYLGLGHLPCLRDAKVSLCSEGYQASRSRRAAEAAIMNEANVHPNHPRVIIEGTVSTEVNESDEEESYTDQEQSNEEESYTDQEESDEEESYCTDQVESDEEER